MLLRNGKGRGRSAHASANAKANLILVHVYVSHQWRHVRCIVVGLGEAIIIETTSWCNGNGRGMQEKGAARKGCREEELRLWPWWIEKRSEVFPRKAWASKEHPIMATVSGCSGTIIRYDNYYFRNKQALCTRAFSISAITTTNDDGAFPPGSTKLDDKTGHTTVKCLVRSTTPFALT